MPEAIQRAVKNVLRENNVADNGSFVSVEAVIQELDDMDYWSEPLGYDEKYKRIEQYLFTDDELNDPLWKSVPPEVAALLSEKLKDIKVIGMGNTINEPSNTHIFPDVIDDEHSN